MRNTDTLIAGIKQQDFSDSKWTAVTLVFSKGVFQKTFN